jgi:hypothetical protein
LKFKLTDLDAENMITQGNVVIFISVLNIKINMIIYTDSKKESIICAYIPLIKFNQQKNAERKCLRFLERSVSIIESRGIPIV